MNYKVLYRKYRPDVFENVVGQEYIIKTLMNSIINDKISHAYIFSGPRGTGKTSTAKIFAKAINCMHPVEGSPCGECEFCKNFNENPDIVEMDAASNNGVDEIRELIDNVKLTPTNGKYKVYIIDEVHMLTTSAFNALLLTLEEPPKHIVFILATTNIENVPITIQSRCQRFDFQKIESEKISSSLKNICSLEKIEITDDALEEIANMSDGGMRDALSFLDQLSKNKEKITLEIIENQYKILTKKNIEELLDLLEQNDADGLVNLITEFEKRNVDYKKMLKRMIDCLSVRAKNLMLHTRNSRLKINDYKRLVLDLSNLMSKSNINVNSFSILTVTLLDYFSVNNDEQKLSEPDNIIKNNNGVEIKKSKNDLEIRINNCFVNAQKTYLDKAKEIIKDVCQLSDINGKIKAILLDSNVVVASDKYMVFSCQSDHLADDANDNVRNIEEIIRKQTNIDYRIVFVTEDKWNNLKNEYIFNKKNGKKYELIENEEKEDIIVNEVFDISKVEIV